MVLLIRAVLFTVYDSELLQKVASAKIIPVFFTFYDSGLLKMEASKEISFSKKCPLNKKHLLVVSRTHSHKKLKEIEFDTLLGSFVLEERYIFIPEYLGG